MCFVVGLAGSYLWLGGLLDANLNSHSNEIELGQNMFPGLRRQHFPATGLSGVPNCSYSAPYNYTFLEEALFPEAKHYRAAWCRFVMVMATYGVPIIARNSELLMAYRHDPSLDFTLGPNPDVDVFIVAPDASLQTVRLIELVAARHRGEIGADVHIVAPLLESLFKSNRFPVRFLTSLSGWLNWFLFSEELSALFTICLDKWCKTDAIWISEQLFEHDDFKEQTKKLYGLDVDTFFAPNALCLSPHLGHMELSVDDPHARSYLNLVYGERFAVETMLEDQASDRYSHSQASSTADDGYDGWAYMTPMLYARYWLRTDPGRRLYCMVGNLLSDEPPDPFQYSTSAIHARPVRDINGTLVSLQEQPLRSCANLVFTGWHAAISISILVLLLAWIRARWRRNSGSSTTK